MLKENLKYIYLGVSVIIAALIIAAAVIFGAKAISNGIVNKPPSDVEKFISENIRLMQQRRAAMPKAAPDAASEEAEPGERKVEGVTAGANVIKGDPKAPVLMVEFSDFQCPFSKKFYRNAFALLDKEYISTGKIKFAYRDLPLGFHPEAKPAAYACECAGKQNKYWQMFEKLHLNDKCDDASIKQYAKDIGLDMGKFGGCIADPKTKEEVENDAAAGNKFGVQGTPSFFINGRFVEGAMPFDVLKKIIEEELSKNKKR